MMNRTITASAALFLAAATAMVGCASDNRADDSGKMAHNNGRNANCPMCGMHADAAYTAWDGGTAVSCCSQACADRFNNASAADKQRWVNKAYRTSSSGETWNDEGVWSEARTSNYPDRPYTVIATNAVATDSNGIREPKAGETTTATTPGNNRAVVNATKEQRRDAVNRSCPITGKSVSDKYTFVDADGTRLAFHSQEAADLYMSYGPEHRAEVRKSMRQQH